jgi:hypothetical protein
MVGSYARSTSPFFTMTSWREARGSMTKRLLTLDQLPLFADDSSIGAALFGSDRAGDWTQIASLLETRGLPKIDALMGGRYVPAVRAFFDRDYGLSSTAPLAPDGTEDLGAWKRKRQG